MFDILIFRQIFRGYLSNIYQASMQYLSVRGYEQQCIKNMNKSVLLCSSADIYPRAARSRDNVALNSQWKESVHPFPTMSVFIGLKPGPGGCDWLCEEQDPPPWQSYLCYGVPTRTVRL